MFRKSAAKTEEKASAGVSAALQHVPGQLALMQNRLDQQTLLQGRTASFEVRRMESIDHLADTEFKAFSQWGEDGIVEWLVHFLAPAQETFVEFGVENFLEANTRFLLENRNWKGLVMDGTEEYMAFVRQQALHWRHDITAAQAFVTAENINSLLAEHGFDGELGILSIDIDGNDYWILKAIENVSASILIMEYNPILGDEQAVTTAYKPDFTRFEAHHSGLLFGASIRAIRDLAAARGYVFAGTCSNGINAFFIREDLYPRIENRLRRIVSYPSRHRDSRDPSQNLSFTPGSKRLELILDEEVHCCESGEMRKLSSFDRLYSDAWKAGMDGAAMPAD